MVVLKTCVHEAYSWNYSCEVAFSCSSKRLYRLFSFLAFRCRKNLLALTCESNFDEIERMQHKGGHNTAGYTGDEMLVLESTQYRQQTWSTTARCTRCFNRRHFTTLTDAGRRRWRRRRRLFTVRYRDFVIAKSILILTSESRDDSSTYSCLNLTRTETPEKLLYNLFFNQI